MYQSSPQFSFGPRLTPWVKRLLIANVVIFLITSVNLPFFFQWFGFVPSRVLLQPWGAVTYMFLHGGLMHLAVNMLVLFFFGPPLEAKWGSTEFLRFYIVCGLGGVALSFLFQDAVIVGASAAIYGLMLAFAMNWPETPIYIWGIFPVKAKWLVGFLFLVSLMEATSGGGGNIAHFAHLGGLVAGFVYLRSDWRSGKGPTAKKTRTRVRHMAPVPRNESSERASPRNGRDKADTPADEAVLDEVDRILDKISASGITSLTPEERRTLDDVSKRRRTN